MVPEREFAARYPYPISIHISIPGDGDTKFVTMSISVTSKVKDLKDALVEQTGIAANKQQIKYMGAFLKDPQTFAAVNIGDGVTVEMIGRSRGGKR